MAHLNESHLWLETVEWWNSQWDKGAVRDIEMTLSFRTDRSGQTVQTQIRLLLYEQSDEDLPLLHTNPLKVP